MFTSLFLSALLIAGDAPPAAAPVPTPVATAAAAPRPGDDKVVCEEQEETGSRLGGHKVCMTRAQWRDQRLRDRMEVEGRQHRWDAHGG